MTDTEKMSYALGMNVYGNLAELPFAVDFTCFRQAVGDALAGKPQLSQEEYAASMRAFEEKVRSTGAAALKEAVEANRASGKKFLAENGGRPGVETTASGLQYEILSEGTGRRPAATDTVRVHYTGKTLDGKVFDSSVSRGEPAEFALNQVISGWTEGVAKMKEGAKYRFFIPDHLAYGERGAGQAIPPGATLIFDVELLKVL